MASSMDRISSSRGTSPLMPGKIVIAFDATKIRNVQEFKDIISNIRKRNDMIQEVDTIKVLGVLHKVLHPMGFHIQIGPQSFIGAHVRAIKEEVSRKVDAYERVLQRSAEEFEGEGIDIEVKIAVGAPMNKVVVQEIVDLNATWAILDRQLVKELRYYLKHIPCKIALVCDNLSLEILRSYRIAKNTDTTKHKLLYSLSKPVSLPPAQDNESDKNSVNSLSVSSSRSSDNPTSSFISSSQEHKNFLQDEFGSNPEQEISGSQSELEKIYNDSRRVMQTENHLQNHPEVPIPSTAPVKFSSDNSVEEGINGKEENGHDGSSILTKTLQIYPDTPLLCTADEIKTSLGSLGCSYSNIQSATDNFSSDNLLGEGGYGVVVYKGQLKDGQLIAVKVQKEANTQRFADIRSEVYALRFARHKNIVALLGYCCRENLNILIYEYICNKSLEWHLFDNTEQVLEWHQRHAIAVGTAKGLRFLHEECQGSPIIHRDIRPSNILLKNDFVPLLGDYGLAKWKTSQYDEQKRTIGNLAYLAPEYTENDICSVKSDVYAFGIVLIQLISGRKAVDATRDNHKLSIRQWALPLIETLALCELVDPHLGDSYCHYELYNMARAAYLCIQAEPTTRPTMGEVLCILEGTNDHLRHVKSNLYPMISSTEGQS